MNRKTQLTLGRQDDDRFLPSTIPSTREDLQEFEERFHMILHKEFALENGLCPKRRRIYDDFFNELIRITKIHCFERGLLLERIRDEYHQWMQTYEELYSSSMAYGMRQCLYKTEEKKNLDITISILENECQQIRDELERERKKYEEICERNADQELEELRRNVRFLRFINLKLRNDLEKCLTQILASPIFLVESTDYETNNT